MELLFSLSLSLLLRPKEIVKTVKNYSKDLPYRPKAVDLEISTTDKWNFGLVVDPAKPFAFNHAASSGWTTKMAFDTENHPFSIKATARQLAGWGYWEGSQITASLPSSPVDCTSSACGTEEAVELVPFGGTNIRIGVFPWMSAVGTGTEPSVVD